MKALFLFMGGILSSCAIEKPGYETLEKAGDFEVRKYQPIKVVSAPMEDMGKRDDSFRKLFKYISGENDAKQKIAMTSPVFMEDGKRKDQATAGKMSFMIPAKVAESGAPDPDGEGLEIREIPGGKFAVLRFKGWNKEEDRNKAASDLAGLVAGKKLKPEGQAFFAIYDPPWIPEPMRRNEVWQRLAP